MPLGRYGWGRVRGGLAVSQGTKSTKTSGAISLVSCLRSKLVRSAAIVKKVSASRKSILWPIDHHLRHKNSVDTES